MEILNTDNNTSATKVGFLLLNHFTMVALACAVDPLRMANQLSGQELYSWSLMTSDGDSVTASDGIKILPDMSIAQAQVFDIVIVVGGINVMNNYSRHELSWLRSLDKKKVILGGICTGAYALAHAGLMNNQDCSIHWECSAALQESFPRVHCNNKLFTITSNRLTSSGGIAPMDMMLTQIQSQHGELLSNEIASMFTCEKVRNQEDQQRAPQHNSLHITQPKLIEIIELMAANIEEPLDLKDLAGFLDLSRRQQERLFHKYMGCPPSRYYLKLRLNRARQLLKQSIMSIIDISAACGFISPAHFSRCYRKYLGVSPREERSGIKSILSQTPEHAHSLLSAQSEPSFASIGVEVRAIA